ncbi:MAG: nucleotide exchange factor GrpE [Candidatus Hodarchaeales archaeon]|jgi:molecular chaperone GrpE
MNNKTPQSSDENEFNIVDIEEQIKESDSVQRDSNKLSHKFNYNDKKSDESLHSRITELETLLKEKEKEVRKGKDQYLRAIADYDNLNKRTKAEMARIIKNANEDILLKFLDIADSFEKGKKLLETDGDSSDSFKKGFLAIEQQFFSILKGEGVEKVKSIGEKFDPAFHEVISVRSDPDIEDNTIIEEVQAGYLQNSILLRPSKVIIIK